MERGTLKKQIVEALDLLFSEKNSFEIDEILELLDNAHRPSVLTALNQKKHAGELSVSYKTLANRGKIIVYTKRTEPLEGITFNGESLEEAISTETIPDLPISEHVEEIRMASSKRNIYHPPRISKRNEFTGPAGPVRHFTQEEIAQFEKEQNQSNPKNLIPREDPTELNEFTGTKKQIFKVICKHLKKYGRFNQTEIAQELPEIKTHAVYDNINKMVKQGMFKFIGVINRRKFFDKNPNWILPTSDKNPTQDLLSKKETPAIETVPLTDTEEWLCTTFGSTIDNFLKVFSTHSRIEALEEILRRKDETGVK